jgi:hypothetical protein
MLTANNSRLSVGKYFVTTLPATLVTYMGTRVYKKANTAASKSHTVCNRCIIIQLFILFKSLQQLNHVTHTSVIPFQDITEIVA